jgi:hypothetical protein
MTTASKPAPKCRRPGCGSTQHRTANHPNWDRPAFISNGPPPTVCGTCRQPAVRTPGNQGYSECCNDRIEDADERR